MTGHYRLAQPVLLTLTLAALVLGGCATRPAAPVSTVPEVVLRWDARNETGVYGYLVFRADAAEGPFLRASREIIHAVAESGVGDATSPADSRIGSYTFVDREVEAGRTYYYTLDVVQKNGKKVSFSGVLSKTVSR